MALIKCPECGAQVSDKALRCPQCGHPIAKPKASRSEALHVTWIVVAIIALIIAIFALIGSCHWKPVI